MTNVERENTRLFQMLSNGKMCAYCQKAAAVCEHHLIRRAASEILRYEPLNGIECCQGCHNAIHDGKLDEWGPVGNDRAARLYEIARTNFKDYLLSRGGMTRDEFYIECREKLRRTVLREDDFCARAYPFCNSIPF